MALAGIYGALRISGRKLTDQRFLFLGAGSAATEIAELISQSMTMDGLTLQQARSRNNLFDLDGLLTTLRRLMAFQEPFAIEHTPINNFADAVKALRPTGIIGVSTVPKLFNRQVIEAMSEITSGRSYSRIPIRRRDRSVRRRKRTPGLMAALSSQAEVRSRP